MDQVNNQPFPFMRLPPEIRNEIHRYLLSAKHTQRVLTPGTEEDVPVLVRLSPSYTYEFHTNVLCVNHQVHYEVNWILYGENLFIALATKMEEINRLCHRVGLRPVAWGDRALIFKKFEQITMWMAFGHSGGNSKETLLCVFPCEDLHLLCRGFLDLGIFDAAFLRRLRIKVSICGSKIHDWRSDTPSALSNSHQLLEPLTKLHSIEGCGIIGPVDAQYRAHIIEQVTLPAPNLGSAIADISALKDEGNVAYRNHQDALAIARYEAALINLLTTFWSHKIIKTGEFINMTTSHASYVLYHRLVSDLAAVLLQTGRLAESEYWARHTEKEVAPIDGKPRESWQLPFSNVLACKAVGEIEQAAINLRYAMVYDPGNAMMEKELVVLEREAEVLKKRDPEKYQAIEDAISAIYG